VKRKIGTTLDSALYRRVQEIARRQGRTTNAVIEEALARYVSSGLSRASVVEETKGTYKVSPKALRAILSEPLYGPE
jgi:Ribbon-helix-helix protein, copG family